MMSAPAACRSAISPYESGLSRAETGMERDCALRPGGVELTERAIQWGGWGAGERVLDLGCGQGHGLDALRRRNIVALGLDPSRDALALVRRALPSSQVVAGRGEGLPFAPAVFDGVLAECSLSVTADPDAVLAGIARVLTPGGRLVATDMYARAEGEEDAPDPALPRCLAGLVGVKIWRRRLERAGLVLDVWEDHSRVLGALMAALLFELGTLAPLWGGAGDGPDAARVARAVRQLRPGYQLFVARKGGEPDPARSFPVSQPTGPTGPAGSDDHG
jgi:arsenite methyltransferase